MMNSLYTAATGMSAMQMHVDTIANNLANVNTDGFKANRMTFEDLLYQQVGDRQAARQGAQVGMGVAPSSTQINFNQGDIRDADVNTNMAIEGRGFFQVSLPDGSVGFTRDGGFQVDANGQLVTRSGYQLEPIIAVPAEADANSLKIGTDGQVTCTVGGAQQDLGDIKIATFVNPAGLEAVGSNTYLATTNSGLAQINVPGENGAGAVQQGKIEGSNVQVLTEMVDMINAQRAFESVSKVISTSDEMLSIANQMRR